MRGVWEGILDEEEGAGFGVGQGTAVSRLGELRWDIFEGVEVETASILWGLSGRRRLIHHWELGDGLDMLGTHRGGGGRRHGYYRSHRFWNWAKDRGRRSSSGWFFCYTYTSPTFALSSVQPREGFSFVWGTCYYLVGRIGGQGKTTHGKTTWEEEEEEGVITAPTAQLADRTGLDWTGLLGTCSLEPGTWEGQFWIIYYSTLVNSPLAGGCRVFQGEVSDGWVASWGVGDG